jgi:signal transduction histidine kinase
VSDDGPGIAPEHRGRVFDRFTRLDTARSSDDGGTGLGLAIASAIVERHKGTLRLDPQSFPGARFILEIPT